MTTERYDLEAGRAFLAQVRERMERHSPSGKIESLITRAVADVVAQVDMAHKLIPQLENQARSGEATIESFAEMLAHISHLRARDEQKRQGRVKEPL